MDEWWMWGAGWVAASVVIALVLGRLMRGSGHAGGPAGDETPEPGHLSYPEREHRHGGGRAAASGSGYDKYKRVNGD